ncbi:hypothetical protein L1049_001636 [Liquidambar formosana]|uniref:Beta-glucosidase n=1 Tax=Liquidambar formosana TaxID=63359 RepID=A0AAP0R3C4_LIQFO
MQYYHPVKDNHNNILSVNGFNYFNFLQHFFSFYGFFKSSDSYVYIKRVDPGKEFSLRLMGLKKSAMGYLNFEIYAQVFVGFVLIAMARISLAYTNPIDAMAIQGCWLLLAILVLVNSYACAEPVAASHEISSFNRSSFPACFIFGTSSAAYQYEGGAKEGGKGPNRILGQSNGDVAVDFYHRYKEDVQLMKDMGMDAFRFSISWSRLLPRGNLSEGVNKEGIRFYNNLINELLSNGLQPFVTIFHFDLPQALEDEYGGFLSPRIVFMDPLTYGDYPHTMRAHIRQRLPKFTEEQSMMVKGSFDFIGINYYTSVYVANVPVANTVNISYLTDSLTNFTNERNGIPIGPSDGSTFILSYPRGLRDLLIYTKEKYNNPTIYITENGVNERNNDTLPLKEALNDTTRINYHHQHLVSLRRAINDGVDVKGYFAWSLLDNFEWSSGYTTRFGINFVDYKDGLKRYLKDSAFWFKKFLQK